MSKILLPVGKGFEVEDAVRALELLARAREHTITLMTAIEIPITTPLEEGLPIEKVKDAESRLEKFKSSLESLGYSVETKVVPCRHVHEAIVEEVKAPEYAAVVLLKRAKKSLLERSVTARVVSSTTKPVIVVPVL